MRQIMFQPRRTDNLSAGLFGRSLGGSGGSFLDRSGRELGLLVGDDVLDIVGQIDLGTVGAGGKGCDDGDDHDESDQSPGEFLQDVGGLADAECLVAGDEVAGETLSLAILQQYDQDEEDRGDDDENGQDGE